MAQSGFGAFIGSDNLRQPQVIVTRPPGRTDVDLTENDLAISRESLGSWTMDDLYLMSFRNTQMDGLDAWNAARIGKQQDSDAARIRKKQDSDADTFPITDGSLEDILRDLPRGPHGLTASLVDCALRILLHGWRDNVNKRRDRATCASDLLQSEDGRLSKLRFDYLVFNVGIVSTPSDPGLNIRASLPETRYLKGTLIGGHDCRNPPFHRKGERT